MIRKPIQEYENKQTNNNLGLKLFLFSVITLFLGILYSCDQDLYIEENINESELSDTDITIRTISKKEVQGKYKLYSQVAEFNSYSINKSQTNTSLKAKNNNRTTYQNNPEQDYVLDFNAFIVDYTQGKEIVKGEYHSYTFPLIPIENNSPTNYYHNIVFTENQLGNNKTKVIVYYLTENQKQALINGNLETNNLHYEYFELDSDFNITNSSIDCFNFPDGSNERVCCLQKYYNLYQFLPDACEGINLEAEIDHIDGEDGTGGDSGGDSGDGGNNLPIIIIPPFDDSDFPDVPPSDGGGGGGSNNPNTPGDTPDEDDSNENDGSFTDFNDCIQNDGCDLTTPIIADLDNPCEIIAIQFENQNLKYQLLLLDSKVRESREYGFSGDTRGGFPEAQLITPIKLEIELNSKTNGYSHTHPSTPMFSPQDFITFWLIVMKTFHNPDSNPKEAYGVMQSAKGNYMLKFTGNIRELLTPFKPPSELPIKEREIRRLYQREVDEADGDLEKAFINLLQNTYFKEGIKFKDAGFHLIKFDIDKMDGSIKNTEEVYLDNNNNTQRNNCNE